MSDYSNKRPTKDNYTAPYLDQISGGHIGSFRKASYYKNLLIQPVQIPNLEHCGISSKLVSSQTDSNSYITPDGRPTQTLRDTIHNVLPAIRKSYLEYQAKKQERKERTLWDYDDEDEAEYYDGRDEGEIRQNYEVEQNVGNQRYDQDEGHEFSYEDNSKELIKSGAEFVTEGYMGDDSMELSVSEKKKIKKKKRRSRKKAKVKVRVGSAILSNPKGYVL